MRLKIDSLNKIYGKDKAALTDFSLEIGPGILGLLGPNGAGKSTLMKVISTISKPSSGRLLLDDVDLIANPDHIRKLIGYLPQDFGVYDNLNAIEFLRYIAALKGIDQTGLDERIDFFLDAFNLSSVAKKAIGNYSGGMKQRIGIAQALLNDPKIIVMDEPTVGLDPEERVNFRQLIADLSGERIVILSSHIVSDIESIADRVAIMKNGRLLTVGDQSEIVRLVGDKIAEASVPKSIIEQIKQDYILIDSTRGRDNWNIRFILNGHQPGFPFDYAKATLEDAYLFLTKAKKHVA
ncbi:MAG: ABC transporter ATP-binding protein [Calditrichaeota bacterium]|nr:ABC transporter ATP-binding protein [Calditrichota bacterium]